MLALDFVNLCDVDVTSERTEGPDVGLAAVFAEVKDFGRRPLHRELHR